MLSAGGEFVSKHVPRWRYIATIWSEELAKPIPPPPPPKLFVKKNPDIPTLSDYSVEPKPEFWDSFPSRKLPKSPYTPANAKRFRDYAARRPIKEATRIRKVADNLEHGADTCVRGVGLLRNVSTNAPSSFAAGVRTTDAIASMVQLGFISGPFDSDPFKSTGGSKISGLMAVEKPDGSIRPVLNLSAPKGSSFNDGVDENLLFKARMCSAKMFCSVLWSAGARSTLIKKDQKNAYKYVPTQMNQLYLQAFSWLGKFFVETSQIFGAVSAVGNFDEFHHSLLQDIVLPQCQIPRHLVSRTIDDIPACEPESDSPSWLEEFNNKYENTCAGLGITLAPDSKEPDKAFTFVQIGTVYGVLFNTKEMTWKFPLEKHLRLLHDVLDLAEKSVATRKEVEKLNGKLQNFGILIPLTRFYKSEILLLLRTSKDDNQMLPITPTLKTHLSMWASIIRLSVRGLPIPKFIDHPPPSALQYYSDAAGGSNIGKDQGVASIRREKDQIPLHLAILRWSKAINEGRKACDGKSLANKTTSLELLGAVLPLVTDTANVLGKSIVVHVDNIACHYVWKAGYSNQDPLATTIVKMISHLTAAMAVTLFIEHVPRCSTPEAIIVDTLSKGDLSPLVYLTKHAGFQVLPRIPQALLNWINNPIPDEDLGPRILKELARRKPFIPLLGYTAY